MFSNLTKSIRIRKNQYFFKSFNYIHWRLFSDQATLPVGQACFHRIEDNGPALETLLKKEDGLKYYREMSLIRRMEQTFAKLYTEKKIRGFCHLYSGQEACAVGIHSLLRSGDYTITAYRCHGWTLMSGTSLASIVAEMCGKETGCSAGRGGSMHMYGRNFFGGNGIVGAHVPLGVGAALAIKLQNRKNVCVSAYGDGAANQGQIFEVFNMAKIWNLPAIFVVENNLARGSCNPFFYERGDVIPGLRIDAMDVLTVREAIRYAIDYCDSGRGPIIIEAMTYRYFGHSMSDPGISYRSRDEVKKMREENDPIHVFEQKLLSHNLCNEMELKDIKNGIKKVVDDAVTKALADKRPDSKTLAYNIYSDQNIKTVRGVKSFEQFEHKVVKFTN